jgi:hypothetical protein
VLGLAGSHINSLANSLASMPVRLAAGSGRQWWG